MRGEDQDRLIAEMMRSIAEVLIGEMPETCFVMILGRSSDDEGDGSLLSLSNLNEDDTVQVLEMILDRRRTLAGQSPSKTVQ